MKIIGERLRSLRESVRLSQAKLAKEFDVSQSALARYEIADSTPSPEVFLKYADYRLCREKWHHGIAALHRPRVFCKDR